MEANTSRMEFLQNALNDVAALAAKRAEYAKEQQRFRESERFLDALNHKIEADKQSAIHDRRVSLETEFNKLLREAENKISDAERRRKSARTGAMNGRIRTLTKEPRERIKRLRGDIRRIMKENSLSGICGTKFFMSMFAPSGIPEVLKMILGFIILLVLIPFLVTLLIEPVWLKIVAFVLIDAAFIALYILVFVNTVAKKRHVFRECREIMNTIRTNEKEIRGITRKIVKDPDDSCYNLGNYDAELTKLNQEKNDIVMKKQEAMTEFEQVTVPKIKEETDAANAEELEKLRKEFAESSDTTKNLAAVIAGEADALNRTCLAEIGEENMTPEGIARLIEEEKKKG